MTQAQSLISFSSEGPARLLTTYLQSEGIASEYSYEPSASKHHVVLKDEDEQARAYRLAEEFVKQPKDPKYQQAAWSTGASVNLQQASLSQQVDIVKLLKAAPVTSVVLITCLIIYVLANIGIDHPYQWLRIQALDVVFQNGQWWRVLGPALIHFSLLHIAFNLLWWWTLGKQIEQKFGSSTLLMLFLFTALLSNIGQLLISGPNFGGLSGVVYGLVGCVWWLGWLRPAWGVSLPKPLVVFLLIWLLIGYADILWVSMANTAHTVGLLSGCGFALFLVAIAGRPDSAARS